MSRTEFHHSVAREPHRERTNYLLTRHPEVRDLWLALFPIVQALRPIRLREIDAVDRWVATNFVAQMTFNVAIWILWGPVAFFYLLLSLFFGIGLHPLGARWIQRHYMTGDSDEQETFSYYGPLNRVERPVPSGPRHSGEA